MGARAKVRKYPAGGKRYYVIDVNGFTIEPDKGDLRAASGGYRNTASYAVLDRDWNHREMGVFIPSTGRSSARCQRQAEILAAYLNLIEELSEEAATNGARATA